MRARGAAARFVRASADRALRATGSPDGYPSEWFWEFLDGKNITQFSDFMATYYPELGGDYQKFAPLFTAQLFNATEWAELFQASGARYVVLTSKHHEGFATWARGDMYTGWKQPWSADLVGPKRDLVGELTDAVRGAGLTMGLYHSQFEWFNPVYLVRSLLAARTARAAASRASAVCAGGQGVRLQDV